MIQLLAMFLITQGAVEPRPSTVLIEHIRFACLVRHIDDLIADSERMVDRRQPRTIDLRRCPPVIREEYTWWPPTRVPRFVRLTEADLLCIRSNRNRVGRLVRDRGRGVYELRLAVCYRQ
jgi:hypothetical protein